MKSRYAVTIALIAFTAFAIGCSRSADELPAMDTGDAEQPTAEAAPAAPTPGGDAHLAAMKHAGGDVTPQSASGNVQILPVESNYACRNHSDCTSTKYSNIPRSEDDCACAAACTPFVVSKAEADRREAANKRLCDTNDWYGDQCPAPACEFVEFESFKCVAGKCVGMALGK